MNSINWDHFKCKECKRGYKEINSFLVNGYCIPCIRKVMRLRSIGIFTDEQRAHYIAGKSKRQAGLPKQKATSSTHGAQKKNFQIQKNSEEKINSLDQTIATL